MHVRFAPKADKKQIVSVCPLSANRVLTRRSKKAPPFDHLVGAGEERDMKVDPDRLCRSFVYHRLKLGGLFDRQVGRIGPAVHAAAAGALRCC